MEARLAAFPYKEEIAAQLLTIQKLCVELEAACAKGQESSSEIQILKEKLARVEQEKLAAQGDVEAVREKCKRILEDRNAAVWKESSQARRSLLEEYGIVLDKVREKLQKKKEETTAEVALQEVRAKIEVLSEYQEGGFEPEEELEWLWQKETDCDVDYGAAVVLDSSLGRIELPEVSGDSVNQDFGNATDQVDSWMFQMYVLVVCLVCSPLSFLYDVEDIFIFLSTNCLGKYLCNRFVFDKGFEYSFSF